MKQIIRWAAKWSGVEQEIRESERIRISFDVNSFHFWMCRFPMVYNSIHFVEQEIRKGGYFNFEKLRDKILEFGNKHYHESNA